MRRLASYLYQLGSNDLDSTKKEQLTAQLKQQTMEVSFMIRRLMLQPKAHKAIVTGKLDEGSAADALDALDALDAKFYRHLVVCGGCVLAYSSMTCCPMHCRYERCHVCVVLEVLLYPLTVIQPYAV